MFRRNCGLPSCSRGVPNVELLGVSQRNSRGGLLQTDVCGIGSNPKCHPCLALLDASLPTLCPPQSLLLGKVVKPRCKVWIAVRIVTGCAVPLLVCSSSQVHSL